MMAEFGQFLIALAFAVSLLQMVAGLGFSSPRTAILTRAAAFVQMLLIGFAFSILVVLFWRSDFSLRIVFENSHSALPLLYRLTGAWANHEGSMLLWEFVLAVFGGLIAVLPRSGEIYLTARTLGVLGLISAVFLAFIVFTSNPYARLVPAPLDGLDLNPVLQDPGLAFHPPVLYFGYVGFSVAFAYAMAGLIENRIDAAWARAVRPWVLLAWVALTLGITFGSYWAYYELGWGGYWFWDPVENASLLPWLAGTALLHSIIVVERREALKAWSVLLAILTFAMSLVGTFLVRSGVLTSVHAFASNPERGLFILAIVIGLISGALFLFALRAPALKRGGAFATFSREGLLVVNNLMLSAIALAVLLGTLYPILIQAFTGDLISVGAPYFNLVCGMLVAPLVLILPMGPFAPWKRAKLSRLGVRLMPVTGVTIIVLFLTLFGTDRWPLTILIGVIAASWVMSGAVSEMLERMGMANRSLHGWLSRTRGISRASWGSFFAHFGIGMLLLGICLSSGLRSESSALLSAGGTMKVGAATIKLLTVDSESAPGYRAERGQFAVSVGGRKTQVRSERRRFWVREITTTEVGLARFGASIAYIVLGESKSGPQGHIWTVRAYYQPWILLLWAGGVAMAFGGALALSDGRLGRKRKTKT